MPQLANKPDIKGCMAWSAYRHLGHHPEAGKSIFGTSVSEEAFTMLLIEKGPSKPYEGWAKGIGIDILNNCIITKANDLCDYHALKEAI